MYENPLLKRLRRFAAGVKQLVDELSRGYRDQHYYQQLTRSSTAPVLNYSEAIATATDKDYANKVRIALKELRESIETMHMIKADQPRLSRQCDMLINEGEQLAAMLFKCCQKAEAKILPPRKL